MDGNRRENPQLQSADLQEALPQDQARRGKVASGGARTNQECLRTEQHEVGAEDQDYSR